MRTICKAESMPCVDSVISWLQKHSEFTAQYARAKELAMEKMAEEILEIADSADFTTYNPKRLQVDTRKWLMSKLAPKKYGEKIEHAGEMTIKTVLVRPDEKSADARPELKPEFDEQV